MHPLPGVHRAEYCSPMGFLDRFEVKVGAGAQEQSEQAAQSLSAAFPGQEIARTDVVRVSPRFRGATVAAYLATLGLPPEDVYAVIPQHSNDIAVAFNFVYRDRPDYEAGRARWAAEGA